jgi:hypothetical protein
MKVKFEIDASPEEWRRFFGMPDMTEIHQELLSQAKQKMQQADFDPFVMMQQMMPKEFNSMADFQKKFWENLFNQKS